MGNERLTVIFLIGVCLVTVLLLTVGRVFL